MSLIKTKGAGFLLVETIIAIVIIGILLTGIALSLNEFRRLNGYQLLKQRCIAAGQAQLDSIAAGGEIISDEEIVFPEVIHPDVLLTMNQPSMNKYANSVKETGMLIADSSFVKEIPEVRARIFSLPLTELGRQAGGVIVSNMVALGSLLGLSGVASVESVRKAVLNRVPKGTEEMNVRALELGLQAGTQALFPPSEAEAGVGPGE